ncbi:DoxX family protein [Dyella choica]|uniref:DoxX family protein n=1 Tax=Dyella choica TaxID=1927959 RepID=A0A3S0SC76_9GAMM|nr:DoxX family protein [Dyella choica]RUL78949.1 DoxX family protein [Dyella choica]
MTSLHTTRQPGTAPNSTSTAMRRVGYGLSTFAVLFLLLDAGMKVMALPVVLQASAQLGYPATAGFAHLLAAMMLASTLLYVIPRTSVLGAVLLTAYLGGAVASHLRVGDPVATHDLFGVYLAIFIWGGLYLRNSNLRAVFPWCR